MNHADMEIAAFVKEARKKFGLTQIDLADKAGVGRRLVRALGQGKQTLGLARIKQVLRLSGRQVGAVS